MARAPAIWFESCVDSSHARSRAPGFWISNFAQNKFGRLASLPKKQMDLETVWYEFSPYLYAAFGATALFYGGGSYLLKGSGILLITAVLTILRLRWTHRRALDSKVETAASVLKQSREQDQQGQLWEELSS